MLFSVFGRKNNKISNKIYLVHSSPPFLLGSMAGSNFPGYDHYSIMRITIFHRHWAFDRHLLFKILIKNRIPAIIPSVATFARSPSIPWHFLNTSKNHER